MKRTLSNWRRRWNRIGRGKGIGTRDKGEGGAREAVRWVVICRSGTYSGEEREGIDGYSDASRIGPAVCDTGCSLSGFGGAGLYPHACSADAHNWAPCDAEICNTDAHNTASRDAETRVADAYKAAFRDAGASIADAYNTVFRNTSACNTDLHNATSRNAGAPAHTHVQ